jgi:nicotinamide-nucleotide amidase
MANPRAAIVAVGTEVTEGRIANTNAAEIARRLLQLDIETVLHLAAPDDPSLMRRAFEAAGAAADVVIVTGGLGPTIDDITRDVAAELALAPLETDPASLERLERFFASLGRTMSENNRRQAQVPRGAKILPNPRGTAPGFHIRIGRAEFFFLPGVPHESEGMLEESVLPALEQLFPREGAVRVRRLNCFGLPESKVDAVLAPLFPGPDPALAFNISEGIVQIYLTARAASGEAAAARLDESAARVRAALGACVFSEGKEGLEEALARVLLERGTTVALAESCTGGLAASRLARVPGVSAVLRGGVVAYANDVKVRLLGVPEALLAAKGAVSPEVALAMAEGARRALGAEAAAGITGIAGPGGGTAEKPVGLVYVATAGPGAAPPRVRELRLGGARTWIQRMAALAALDQIRRAVLGIEGGEP